MEQSKLQELLKDMSLEEKINQLFQGAGYFYEDGTVSTGPVADQGYSEKTFREAGSVLGIVGAKTLHKLQEQHMKNHPHHIPMVFMADIINGYKTIFPIPLAQGAAFNPEIARKGAEVAAAEAAATGLHVTFSPMVDMAKDARWGRVMESTGEDAFLNSQYAKAMVEGYQGENPAAPGKIGACVKHFAAYGAPTAGREYNTVELSERTLRDEYFLAYQAAIDAGVTLVMTSFNTLNRIPSSANKWLMRDVLRKEMGFDGVLISDWAAIEEIMNHGAAGNRKEAAKLAMEAGVDMDMVTTCYCNYLKELIEEGAVSEGLLDEAVMRVLKLKNLLGLFENPFKDGSEESEKALLLCDKHRKIAREAAAETFVLLKNEEQQQPLQKDETVAFIGPYTMRQETNGSWSIFGETKDNVTIREGVEAKKAKAVFAKGCEILNAGERIIGFSSKDSNQTPIEEAAKMQEEALELAKNAQKVVLCIGEHFMHTGEAASRGDITVPRIQLDLLREVSRVNKNVSVVLFTGRPLDIREIQPYAKSILVVWMPGTEGGNAIADVLYGDKTPSGKLPMCFPYAVGQVPVFYNEFRTGRHYDGKPTDNRFVSMYLDMPNDPLYTFGYGLTYTDFTYSDITLSKKEFTEGETLTASIKVKNTGKRAGAQVMQMYITDDASSVVRPVRELKGFEKIWLEAGQEKEVTFTITTDLLKFHDIDMNYVAEPGTFHVYIGDSSKAETAAEFALRA